MAAVDDLQYRFLDDFRAAIISLSGKFGQGHKHVELGQHGGGRLDPPALGGHGVAKLQEQFVFQFLCLLVGRENLFLVFLQFRRDVTLGVFYGLLADVFDGNFFAVCVSNLDVIAENLVETDLEVWNARSAGSLVPDIGRSTACRRGPVREGCRDRR